MKGFRPQAQPDPADRTSASARAYTTLRRMILSGELTAGTPVREVEMAAKLEVSRTPVREALRELLSEGMVEEGPRRQAVVGSVSPATLREVCLMRDSLERLTAREAARRPNTSQLDQLRLIMIRARRAIRDNDIAGFLDCDDDFHLQIARAAELPLVEEALRRIRGLFRLATIDTEWTDGLLQSTARQHDEVIDAIETGDPAVAEDAIARHLAESVAVLGGVEDLDPSEA